METSKLMTPLFYRDSFNRKGHRMRAIFEREVTNGTETYRLWRRAGKPDREYFSAENDKYLLYAEINGYLVPLGMSDFYLINRCGFESAVRKLYGSYIARGQRIDSLQKSGGDDAVLAALEVEKLEIERYGSDPALQAAYIHEILAKRVDIYLKAKENGGKIFPDFHGAAVVNDLAKCVELMAIYRAAQKEKALARAAQAAAEEKLFCEEQNRKAEQAISDALRTVRSGGILKNDEIRFYRSKYHFSTYSIVNYLMRKYQVDVPLRTQGWINDKLSSTTIENGRCVCLQYFRSGNGQGSQKFFECMNTLIQAVLEQLPEQVECNKVA